MWWHEASRGVFATAEIIVTVFAPLQTIAAAPAAHSGRLPSTDQNVRPQAIMSEIGGAEIASIGKCKYGK